MKRMARANGVSVRKMTLVPMLNTRRASRRGIVSYSVASRFLVRRRGSA